MKKFLQIQPILGENIMHQINIAWRWIKFVGFIYIVSFTFGRMINYVFNKALTTGEQLFTGLIVFVSTIILYYVITMIMIVVYCSIDDWGKNLLNNYRGKTMNINRQLQIIWRLMKFTFWIYLISLLAGSMIKMDVPEVTMRIDLLGFLAIISVVGCMMMILFLSSVVSSNMYLVMRFDLLPLWKKLLKKHFLAEDWEMMMN